MVALLTPDARAMASMLVASMPRSANSASAASRTWACAWVLGGRAIVRLLLLNLDLRERPGAQCQETGGDDAEDRKIDHHPEVRLADERAPQPVDAVRQWV